MGVLPVGQVRISVKILDVAKRSSPDGHDLFGMLLLFGRPTDAQDLKLSRVDGEVTEGETGKYTGQDDQHGNHGSFDGYGGRGPFDYTSCSSRGCKGDVDGICNVIRRILQCSRDVVARKMRNTLDNMPDGPGYGRKEGCRFGDTGRLDRSVRIVREHMLGRCLWDEEEPNEDDREDGVADRE